jgi:HlyD family secretion protein
MSDVAGPKKWIPWIAGAAIGLVIGLVIGSRTGSAGRPATAQASTVPAARPAPQTVVTALGRLRPRNGVMRVSGPSHMVVVVGKLMVDEGDRVKRGQTIAMLDNHAAQNAAVERLKANVDAQQASLARAEAELRTERNEYQRLSRLHQEGTLSDSQRDAARMRAEAAEAGVNRAQAEIRLARADLRRAQEELEMTIVRAPVDGQVIKVHAYSGEKVGADGIVEIADNEQMYAIAEVYETDVAKIQVGQRATVRTPVFDKEFTGVVERVGLKIGKMDVLGTDPAAKTDARVVEVEVRLDDSAPVNASTNLQVTISIDVSGRPVPAAAKMSSSAGKSHGGGI